MSDPCFVFALSQPRGFSPRFASSGVVGGGIETVEEQAVDASIADPSARKASIARIKPSPRNYDQPVSAIAFTGFDKDVLRAGFHKRRPPSTASARSETLSDGTAIIVRVRAATASAAAIVSTATTTTRTASQKAVRRTRVALITRSDAAYPELAVFTGISVLDIRVAGFPSGTTGSAAVLRATATSTASTNKSIAGTEADAVDSRVAGNAAAFATRPTVILTRSASAACAAGDEYAISQAIAARSNVGCTCTALPHQRTAAAVRAGTSFAAAIVTTVLTMRRSADQNRQHVTRMHAYSGFYQATASGRSASALCVNGNFLNTNRNSE